MNNRAHDQHPPPFFVGIMSGTSLDGIDVALVDCHSTHPVLIDCHQHPLPKAIVADIQALHAICHNEIHLMQRLHITLGQLFGEATLALLKKANHSAKHVAGIGCHGQTIRHHPDADPAYTIQLGSGHEIASITRIPVVTDFRQRDITHGGQGAPLAPAFHALMTQSITTPCAVINIGGIANITSIDKHTVRGFDTGPGNCLMDSWCHKHTGNAWDHGGAWADSGQYCPQLLATLLQDPFFQRSGPKSTGREYFNLSWLNTHLDGSHAPEDIQATLLELTAITIANGVKQSHPPDKPLTLPLFACGGGAHNHALMARITAHTGCSVSSTATLGIDPDWVEAVAFAWFAQQALSNTPIKIASCTGAQRNDILGVIHPVYRDTQLET